MSYDPFIGEIKIFGFNFAPQNYFSCSGQILSIRQYTALFSLLGTTYGGDGVNTFALPDLRGRTPINQGQGPGLSAFIMGQRAGNTTTSLSTMNLPAHIHSLNNTKVTLNANDGTADEQSPSGNHFANAANAIYTGNGGTPGANIAGIQVSGTTDVTGQGIPFDIQNPYLVVNYSIAINGIFPSRP